MATRMKAKGMTVEEYLALPYTVRVIPDPTGGYVATIEELPGCITQGETWEETGAMMRDAMAAWIDVALEDGRPVPVPRDQGEPSKILVRLPYSLHQELVGGAEREGVSLNQFVLYALALFVGQTRGATEAKARRRRAAEFKW